MYQTEKKSIDLLGVSKIIYQITNIDEVFDELISRDNSDIEKSDERIPYWMSIWDSAIALSAYIISNKEQFKNKLAIEIGAGLALPSLFAADYSKEILITDYLQPALDFAKKNTDLNSIVNVQFSLLDWRNTSDEKKYDIVLASDIAYEKRFHDEIPQALNALLHEEGVCFLSEPNRRSADDFLQNQLPKLFDVNQVAEELINNKVPVRVFAIRKK